MSRSPETESLRVLNVGQCGFDHRSISSYLADRFGARVESADTFDDAQQAVYTLPPPCIVIGSAGSGKTALTLEKMKDALGEVLYVTRSPSLVRNARTLYYALAYENDDQDVSFL